MHTIPDYVTDDRFDFAASYTHPDYKGIALHAWGYELEPGDDPFDPDDCMVNPDWIIVSMVGDDRKFPIERAGLVRLDDDDYCPGCGQTGCQWR